MSVSYTALDGWSNINGCYIAVGSQMTSNCYKRRAVIKVIARVKLFFVLELLDENRYALWFNLAITFIYHVI